MRVRPVAIKSFLLGSVLPDLPLILLTIGGIVYGRLSAMGDRDLFRTMFDVWYFQNPFWIAFTSLWHAPLMILAQGLLGFALLRRGHRLGLPLIWFALGAGMHSIADILTHVDDGPVVFFPFNWTYRFASPVSYWDPRHYGREFSTFEHVLDLAIIVFLLWQYAPGLLRKRKARASQR